jgi:hypothetical protein
MQLVANQQLVRNRVRLGVGFHLSALAVFAVGLFLSTTTDLTRELPIYSYGAILVGMMLYALGQTQLRRWGPRNRQEEQLGKEIRGLDDRYKLYAFLSSSLPDYILVSPAGVHVLITRQEDGQVTCIRDDWRQPSRSRWLSFLGGSRLGNPSADAQRRLQTLRRVLADEGLEGVPSGALIVFTNAKVQLRVEGCSTQVTRLEDLEDKLRRLAGKGQRVALTSARIRKVQAVFDKRMQAARAWR